MLESPCYIVSDLHIGPGSADTERRFQPFLRAAAENAKSLVINGDLLDFWFEWRRVMPRTGFRTLARLADVAESGTNVVWIAGNHDWWGGEMLQQTLGVRFVQGPWEGRIAGWQSRVEHGDGLMPVADRRYRLLRSLIRHPLAVGAMRLLHPDLGMSIAHRSSHTSRTYRARDNGAGLRTVALDTLSAPDAPELLVYAHSHVPALERSASGRIYANAGSWLDAPTYLVVTPERISLMRWTESAEGECLDSLDRGPEKSLA